MNASRPMASSRKLSSWHTASPRTHLPQHTTAEEPLRWIPSSYATIGPASSNPKQIKTLASLSPVAEGQSMMFTCELSIRRPRQFCPKERLARSGSLATVYAKAIGIASSPPAKLLETW